MSNVTPVLFIPNVQNKKTGKKYMLICRADNATNDKEGSQYAVYATDSGDFYVRQWMEFEEKFQPIQHPE